MNNEFQILQNINIGKVTTQRDIAKSTGMSLGNVNILIKRLISKGLLKIEKISPKMIKYILTPEGIKEKAQLTYNYIIYSYKYINELNQKMDMLFKELETKTNTKLALIGKNDEICEMLINRLKDKNIEYECHRSELSAKQETINEYIYLVWSNESSDILSDKGIGHINLLEVV